MKIVKAISLALAAIFILIAGAFYVLANHSTRQLDLTCTGRWDRAPTTIEGEAETVYAVIEIYRPWVLWARSDGNVRAESRNVPIAAYKGFVSKIGQEPLANYMIFDREGGAMVGGYRGAANELVFEFSEDMLFVGTCTDGI